MNVHKKASIVACLFALCCLLPVLIRAQTTPAGYEAKWKSVDSLTGKEGLTESALVAVNRIYTLARQEKNDAQMIQALVYRINLESLNREDAKVAAIKELDKEIAEARQPVRSILQNILADVYWNYFQQNRFKFYNRTNTVNFVKEDPATWTIDDFHKKIGGLYLASLQEDRLLQSTRVGVFEPILIMGNKRYLRPTLYDLLAHEALEYFKSSEQDINRPASVFEIDDPAAFSDAASFVNHHFKTDDSLSLHFRALQLFQQLIRVHLSDPQPDALLDVDIERIGFAHTYAVTDNKDSLYLQALVRLGDRYGLLPAAAEAWYLQAEHYTLQAEDKRPAEGGNGLPEDTALYNGNVRAKTICEKVLTEKDSSEGKTDCQILLHNILQKELTMQTEKVNLPNQPLRSLVSWRNFNQLYLRLVRLDSFGKDLPVMNTWQDAYWDKILGLPVYWSSSQVLPGTTDYQTHRAEIGIPSLPVGIYALVASSTPGWSRKEGVMAVQYFYVSSITYINQGDDYFVLNRESGQPLAGASVQFWERVYNSRSRSTELVKKEAYTTDQQGHFVLKARNNQDYSAWVPEVRVPGDHLFVPDAPIPLNFHYEEIQGDGGIRDKKMIPGYPHPLEFPLRGKDRLLYW